MAPISRIVLLSLISSYFVFQITSCAPRIDQHEEENFHRTLRSKNCDLPALLAKLKNQINHHPTHMPIQKLPQQHHRQQENIPSLLHDISSILVHNQPQYAEEIIAPNKVDNFEAVVSNVDSSDFNIAKVHSYEQPAKTSYVSEYTTPKYVSHQPAVVHSTKAPSVQISHNTYSQQQQQQQQQQQGESASNLGSGHHKFKDTKVNLLKGGDIDVSSYTGLQSGFGGRKPNYLQQVKEHKQPSYKQTTHNWQTTGSLSHKNPVPKVRTQKPQTERPRTVITTTTTTTTTTPTPINVVDTVKDSDILVLKEQQTFKPAPVLPNVGGIKINLLGGQSQHSSYTARPVTVYENMGTANVGGHRIPVMKQEKGDIIGSAKETSILVASENSIDSKNIIEESPVTSQPILSNKEEQFLHNLLSTYKPHSTYQKPTVVVRPLPVVSKPQSADFISSSLTENFKEYADASTVRPVILESVTENFKQVDSISNVAYVQPKYVRPTQHPSWTPVQHKTEKPRVSFTVASNQVSDSIGSGLNNIKDSDILVLKDQIEGVKLSGQSQYPSYASKPVTIYENMGTANVGGHHIPIVKQEHGDIIKSNVGAGLNIVHHQPSTFQQQVATSTGSVPVHSNKWSSYTTIKPQVQLNVEAAAAVAASSNIKDSEILLVQDQPSTSHLGAGLSVQEQPINVYGNMDLDMFQTSGKTSSSQYYSDEEDVCDDLEETDVLNVKDILKMILYGESEEPEVSLDKIKKILASDPSMKYLRDILKQLFPTYKWDSMTDKELQNAILDALNKPTDTPFSNFINGLFDYKLAGKDGDMNALYHLLGHTNPDAERQFNLDHVLSTIYPDYGSNDASNYDYMDNSNSAENSGYDYETLNVHNTVEAISDNLPIELANVDNSYVDLSSSVSSSLDTSNAVNSYEQEFAPMYDYNLDSSYEAPGCELFQYLKTKFPNVNEKFIEKTVLRTVSDFITKHQLYNQWYENKSLA